MSMGTVNERMVKATYTRAELGRRVGREDEQYEGKDELDDADDERPLG